MLDHPSSHSVSLMSGMIYLLIILTSRSTVSEIHLIRLTCQATWSLANTPIVVFITVIFSSIVFSCSVLCKFCVFFFFYSRAAVSVVFPPCCPVQVLSCAFCLHHVFLSEQIKMMMMMMMITTCVFSVCTRLGLRTVLGLGLALGSYRVYHTAWRMLILHR